jgi:hypothetical protein
VLVVVEVLPVEVELELQDMVEEQVQVDILFKCLILLLYYQVNVL